MRLAPEVLAPAALAARFAGPGGLPELTVPNMAAAGRARADVLRRLRGVDGDAAADAGTTWPGCASSGGARSCSRASCGSMTPSGRSTPGSTAISVSNHGGNNLDGTPATIRALPAIAEAVGDQVEVVLDGGVRRGWDVVKALALGARAVHDRPCLPLGPRRDSGGLR